MPRLPIPARLLLVVSLVAANPLFAQTLSPQALVSALQKGGMVVVMRHASSPREKPDAANAAAGNSDLERQLDARGLAQAAALGAALERLDIRFARVGTSPAFRARETASQAGLHVILVYDELGNAGMQASGADKARWLRQQTAKIPVTDNVLFITHGPNIGAAFPDVGATREGEALVFNPAVSNTVPVGRMTIDAWSGL